jgi:glycosyltransferase involved in cell wall biosynthesis
VKILFVIGHLNTGGQERKLALLAAGLAERGHQVDVLVTYPGGRFDQDIQASNARLFSVFERYAEPSRRRVRLPGRRRLAAFWAIRRQVLRERYDVVYGMGYRSNLHATIASIQLPTKAVWGIEGVVSTAGPMGRLLERIFVHRTSLMIAVSDETRRYCVDRGFPADRVITVENGVDTTRFRIEPRWRADIRHELGILDSEILIGAVGRIHPVKNFEGFLEAAAIVSRAQAGIRFVIVGSGLNTRYGQDLRNRADELGIAHQTVWTGEREDVEFYYNAMDLYVSSSHSEGFQLTRVEAMVCGTPCVATDVGDAARVIGPYGRVVRVGDDAQLAQAVLDVIDERHNWNREEIRASVASRFSASRQIDRTEEALQRLVQRDSRK